MIVLTRLAWRQLWARRGRSLLLLTALALSNGLVTASGCLGALLQAGAGLPAGALQADRPQAGLWVSSAYDLDYDLPLSLVARVRAVPGVAAALPVLRRLARVQTPAAGGPPRADNLALLGTDLEAYFALHGLELAAGRLPGDDTPGLVALAPWALVRELSLGQPITLSLPAGDVALPLAGLLEVDTLAAARPGLVLYLPYETMAGLLDLQGVATAVEVRPAPRVAARRLRAELEQALGPAYAISSAARPDPQLWHRLVQGALLFVTGLTLLGSALLVYGVFAAGAAARRRQTGLLRAAGGTRRQVLVLVLLEAAQLGLLGSGLGLPLGLLFARLGAGLVLDLPAGGSASAVPLPPAVPLVAVALGLAVALAGAAGPAARAARLPPVVALRPALAEAGPVARRAPWLPVGAPLAVAGLTRAPRPARAAVTVTSLALILAMFLGNVGVLSLLGAELAAGLGRLAGGDYLVLPGLSTISFRELAGQDTSDLPPLSAGLLAALRDLEDQVWLMAGTTADVPALQAFPGQPVLLLDVEGYARLGGFQFREGDWPRALAAFRRGPAVLLTTAVARRLEVQVGDSVTLPTPGGPIAWTVAGIGDSEFASCVLDLADGAAYLGANEVNAVLVQVRPTADAAGVQQALRETVRRHDATLLPLHRAAGLFREMVGQARLAIGLLIAAAGAVAGLGVVNASLVSVAERRQELGLLRAVGFTRRQVVRLILAEAALQGGLAALLGTALGWLATLAFLAVARAHLGLGGQAAAGLTPWLALAGASLAGLVLWPLLAAAGALFAARLAARLPIVDALRDVA